MVSGKIPRCCFCSSERLARTGINARARTTSSAGSGAIVRALFDPSIVPRPARAAWSERIALRYRRGRMVRNPVARDVNAAANPNSVVLEHVIKKFRQALRAAGTADEAVVQGNRHHARLPLAFAVKHIKRVLHVGKKILRGRKGDVAVEPLSLVSYEYGMTRCCRPAT